MNSAVQTEKTIKELEKRVKYFELGEELKKLRNMKVTLIPVVIGALEKIPKDLVKGLEKLENGRRVETIQTTAFSRSTRILRRVLGT